MKTVPLEELTLATFLPLVRTRFRVDAGGRRIDFELAEAVSIRQASSSQRAGPGLAQETFSLVFDGPIDRAFPQGTYTFEHDNIGRFDLFIVPIGATEKTIHYQAVFNRLFSAE